MRDRIARRSRERYVWLAAFQPGRSLSSSLACPFGFLARVFCRWRDVAARSCRRNVARPVFSDRRTPASTETEIGLSPSHARCWRLHACPVAIMAIDRWSAGTELPRQTTCRSAEPTRGRNRRSLERECCRPEQYLAARQTL